MILKLIACLCATAAFAVLFSAPWRALPAIIVITLLGYGLYMAVDAYRLALPAYFAASLCMALLSEAAARIVKMPALVFLMTALIPLVPGLGLYNTMLEAVRGNAEGALALGFDTMFSIAAMAMGVAIASLLMKLLQLRRRV